MARKWFSLLNSYWDSVLTISYIFRGSSSRWIRGILMVLLGMFLAFGFQAIALSQAGFLAQTQGVEGQIVEELNRAGELSNLSLVHQQRGEWQAAEKKINVSLDILENLPITDKREKIYGQTLDILGQLHFARGEFDLALKIWENSEITYRNLGDREEVRRTYINQSRALQRLGLYDGACSALLVSTGLQGRLEEFPGVSSLNCRQFVQLEKIFQLEEGQELTMEIKCDRLTQAIGVFDISCEWVDDLEKALQIPDDSLSLIAGTRLGNVLRAIGELEISLKVLKEVQPSTKSPEQIAKINLSLGNTQQALGNRDQAYEESQEPPSFDFHLCRLNSGIGGKYKAALNAYYQNYLQDIQDSSLTHISAESQLNYLDLAFKFQRDGKTIGEVMETVLGHDRNVIDMMRSQLEYLQTLSPKNPLQDQLIIDYARVFTCLENPNWDRLRNQLNKVADDAKQRNDWKIESSAIAYIGTIYEQEYLEMSKHNKADNQSKILLENAKKYTFLALKLAKPREQEAREINYQIQWQLGRIAKYQQDTQAAIAHYQAAYQNLKELRINLAAFNQEIQYNLRDKVEPIYRELVSLILRSNPTQEQLDLVRQIIESLQLVQLDSFLQDTCTKVEGLKIEEIDPHAAVIYTIALPNSFEVILSLPGEPLNKTLNDSFKHYSQTKISEAIQINPNSSFWKEIDKFIDKISRNLKKQQEKVSDLSTKDLERLQIAYSWLVKPFEQDIKDNNINTLVFSLDGSLRNLPIAALHDGEQYLIKKYPVAITPSLQLLKPREISLKTLKVLASGIKEFKLSSFPNLSNLKGVEDELTQISESISNTEQLLNDKFTVQLFRERMNSLKFPIVHIATHGEFAANAKETSIYAWDREINLEQLGQLLRVSDPSGLKDIELLIFSACQTAEGNSRATLGMAGVAFEAGARSIIGTLWNVNDNSTPFLMSEFYKNLKKATEDGNNANKAKALQLAQLALWEYEGGRYRHPHYWSSFVLVGNWL